MWVSLHPPYGSGKVWEEVDLPSPAGVRDLLEQLRGTHPELKRYFRDSAEETFHHLLLIRGDHVLTEEDTIQEKDRIVVMMPLTGGKAKSIVQARTTARFPL